MSISSFGGTAAGLTVVFSSENSGKLTVIARIVIRLLACAAHFLRKAMTFMKRARNLRKADSFAHATLYKWDSAKKSKGIKDGVKDTSGSKTCGKKLECEC